MLLDRIFSLYESHTSSDNGIKPQPRGLRENIWNASHPAILARSTARSSDPAIETWTPTRIIPTPFCLYWNSKRTYLEGCSLTETWRIRMTMKDSGKPDLTGQEYKKIVSIGSS